MWDEKFAIGDRVVVFQNTERIPSYGFVGKKGVVVGYCSKDVIVQFDNGKKMYIYENDLTKEHDVMCKSSPSQSIRDNSDEERFIF